MIMLCLTGLSCPDLLEGPVIPLSFLQAPIKMAKQKNMNESERKGLMYFFMLIISLIMIFVLQESLNIVDDVIDRGLLPESALLLLGCARE
jgi:hypothetical protein